MDAIYIKLDSDNVCIMYALDPKYKGRKGVIELNDYSKEFKREPERFEILDKELDSKEEKGVKKVIKEFKVREGYDEFKEQLKYVEYDKLTEKELRKKTEYKKWLEERKKKGEVKEDEPIKEIEIIKKSRQ